MKRLWQKFAEIRQHFATLVGLLLCFYFCYHLISGERSYLRMHALENSIETTQAKLEAYRAKRLDLDTKVAMMRPGNVNRDLLEEQVRLNLGYRDPAEMDVLSTAQPISHR